MSERHGAGSAPFFDLDKTILATSSSLALQGSFLDAGLISRSAAIMSVLVHLPYLLRGADADRMDQMARALGDLAKGIDARLLESIVEESLETAIDPVCYVRALEEIARHRAAGRPVVVASASVIEVVRPIAARLGADAVLASRVATDERGGYTGEILHYNQSEKKAEACARLAAERGWDLAECWAYSDSVSDVPLLSSVGHPVAVNPDRGLRAVAEERGWEIARFDETARAPRRLPAPSRRTLGIAAFAIGAGALAVGLAVSRRP